MIHCVFPTWWTIVRLLLVRYGSLESLMMDGYVGVCGMFWPRNLLLQPSSSVRLCNLEESMSNMVGVVTILSRRTSNPLWRARYNGTPSVEGNECLPVVAYVGIRILKDRTLPQAGVARKTSPAVRR